MLAGSLAFLHRPPRSAGHDPDAPVAVNPDLTFLVVEIAELRSSVSRTVYHLSPAEGFGTVLSAVEIRGNDASEVARVVRLNSLDPIIL
jgi:hypothetical protein